MTQGHPIAIPERVTADFSISAIPDSLAPTNSEVVADSYAQDEETLSLNPELERSDLLSGHFGPEYGYSLSSSSTDCLDGSGFFNVSNLASNMGFDSWPHQLKDIKQSTALMSNIRKFSQSELPEISPLEEIRPEDIHELTKSERIDENDVSSEYFSSADTHQSILVSFSSHCVLKGTVCERSRLMRIKFYGCFDKPLGRYLREDLFDQVINYEFPYV